MKIKTSELTGRALAYAVGVLEGDKVFVEHSGIISIQFPSATQRVPWAPHWDWNQGGPIIEREKMELRFCTPDAEWIAITTCGMRQQYGPTPLIAAMRCFCCAKIGDEIEIPQELQPCQQPNP